MTQTSDTLRVVLTMFAVVMIIGFASMVISANPLDLIVSVAGLVAGLIVGALTGGRSA